MSSFDPKQLPWDVPVVDASQLDVIIESAGDMAQAMLQELMDDYTQATQNSMLAVEQNIKQQDTESLKKNLHKIKGSSANLGLSRLAAYCALLEVALEGNSHELDYDQSLDTVKALYQEAVNEMESRVNAL